jgi:hypothetical protein
MPGAGASAELSAFIGERLRHFTPREAAFFAIAGWLEGTSRCFVLSGEPGSGKTAVACRLHVASTGEATALDEGNALGRGWLGASYFCGYKGSSSARPTAFAESLAAQLAARYPTFARALVERTTDRAIHINVRQTVQQGQVVGVVIEHLDASGAPPEDAFARIVREPLEQLLTESPDECIVVLVDALDEALQYGGRVNIVSLLAECSGLPSSVRFVVTSRSVVDVLRPLRRSFPDLIEHSLSVGAGLDASREDVRRYILSAFDPGGPLHGKALAGWSVDELARAAEGKIDGNFLYATHLLRTLGSRTNPIDRASLEALPDGLDGVYFDSLGRLRGADPDAWEERYLPTLGTIAVVQEAITEQQIAAFTQLDRPAVRRVLAALRPFLEVDESRAADARRYALYHRSFADFLLDGLRAEEFWCDAAAYHARVVASYRGPAATWRDVAWREVDDYGLEHLARHLRLAGPRHFDDLLALLNTPFREAKARRFFSDASFASDVQLGIEALEERGPAGLPAVLALSIGHAQLMALARETPPAALLTLARLGHVDEALARMHGLAVAHLVDVLCEVAAIQRSAGRIDESRKLLEQAVHRALQELDEDERSASIARVVRGCDIEDDPRHLATILRPLLNAAPRIEEPISRVRSMLELADQLARVGLTSTATTLRDEVMKHVVALPVQDRGRPLLELLRRRRSFGEATRWNALLDGVVVQGDDAKYRKDGAAWFAAFIMAGRDAEAIALASTLDDGFGDASDHLDVADDVERAIRAIEDARLDMWPVDRIAFVQRLAELGNTTEAMRRLRILEKQPRVTRGLLRSPERFLKASTMTRAYCAETLMVEHPTEGKSLLTEAIELLRQATADLVDTEQTSIDWDMSEQGMLRVAGAISAVPDRVWAEAALDDLLPMMLTQTPLAFLGMSADCWFVRARVVIASEMARIGLEQRAGALFEQAREEAGRIRSPTAHVQACDAIAAGVEAMSDRVWVEKIVRRLLGERSPLDGAELTLTAALAAGLAEDVESHPSLSDIAAQFENAITSLSSRWSMRAYRADLSLQRDLQAELDEIYRALVELLRALGHVDPSSNLIANAWSTLLQIDEGAFRTRLLTTLLPAWIARDVSAAEAAVGGLRRHVDRAVAQVVLARAANDAHRPEKALEEIESALLHIGELDWKSDAADALVAAVEGVPIDLSPTEGTRVLTHAYLIAIGEEWRPWRLEQVVVDRPGEPAAAQLSSYIEVASHIRDAAKRAFAFMKVVPELVDRHPSIARDLLGDALRSAAEVASVVERGSCLQDLAALAGEGQTFAWCVDTVTGFEHSVVRDEALARLAGHLAALGDVEGARRLIAGLPAGTDAARSVAAGLAASGHVEEALRVVDGPPAARDPAIVEIALALAKTCDAASATAILGRIEDVGCWADALVEVALIASSSDDADQNDAAVVSRHAATRLAGADLAQLQARIAGRLRAEPEMLDMAVEYLGTAIQTLGDIEDAPDEACRQLLTAISDAPGGSHFDTVMEQLGRSIGRDAQRVVAVAAVVRRASVARLDEVTDAGLAWILATESWHWLVRFLGSSIDQVDPSRDIEWGRIFCALADVVTTLVDNDAIDRATEFVEAIEHPSGRGLLRARLARDLYRLGHTGPAMDLLATAVRDLSNNVRAVGSAVAELAATYGYVGRVDDANALADDCDSAVERNDVLDAVARAFVDTGKPEEAGATLARMAPYEPFDMLLEYPSSHQAVALLADWHIDRGDLEQAARVLWELTDAYASHASRQAFRRLGRALSDRAKTDAAGVARIAFGLLRQIRTGEVGDAFHICAALSAVLPRVAPTATLETWTRFQHVRKWFSS